MANLDEFAHGYHYGDYSGVVFSAADRLDRIAVSNGYIEPLFNAVLDRAWRIHGGCVPQLVSQWATVTGWRVQTGRVPVTAREAQELAEALQEVAAGDLEPHCAGCTSEEGLRCAAFICEYLIGRLNRSVSLFIEDN